MDWITGMQRAIDYMEDNLTEQLDYAEIARQAYVSSFHFQRVFSILCGYTVGEYIRNRRLTLAGAELCSANTRVIDVALKYCYDSPESFTRSFTRFHGVSPSAARELGANLKSFSRLSIKLSLEGGDSMDYRIERKDAIKVIAKTEWFSADNDVNKKEIPMFWERCHCDGTINKLCEFAKNSRILSGAIVGICESDTDSGSHKFPYSIGAEYTGSNTSEGLNLKEIPGYTWAIFRCIGPMPNAIQIMWHRIYIEFFPASEYVPIEDIDLEVYPEGNLNDPNYVSEIWIPVRRKYDDLRR